MSTFTSQKQIFFSAGFKLDVILDVDPLKGPYVRIRSKYIYIYNNRLLVLCKIYNVLRMSQKLCCGFDKVPQKRGQTGKGDGVNSASDFTALLSLLFI